MGACLSCLGLNREYSPEPSESEGLLYNSDPLHPHYNQYGTTGAGAASSTQPAIDAEELRREREALERICAETSAQLIDVVNRSAIGTVGREGADEPGPNVQGLLERCFARRADGGGEDDGHGGGEGKNEDEDDVVEGGDDAEVERVEEDEDVDEEDVWLSTTTKDGWEEIKGVENTGLVITLNDPAVGQRKGVR